MSAQRSRMPSLLFLLPMQVILTSVHLLLAAILVAEWIPASIHPMFAYGVATVLSFSFLTANIVVRNFVGKKSSLYYRAAMALFGVIYVFFAGAIGMTLLLSGAHVYDHLEVGTLLALQFVMPAAFAVYGFVMTARIRVRRRTLPLVGLPSSWEGKKIAFFSDAHFGPVYGVATAKRLVALLEKESPDLLLIGGDFYDGPPMDFESVGRIFTDFKPTLGKFIVAGNHDEYANIAESRKGFIAAGFIEVDGQMVEIDGVNLTGIEHTHRDEEEVGMLRRAADVKEASGMPFIVLRHEPEREWIRKSAEAGAMLMLSGHTHHGQLFPLSIFTRMRYGKFTYGLHRVGDMQMFTSWGIGSWGPPLRIGTDRELVIFTCKKIDSK